MIILRLTLCACGRGRSDHERHSGTDRSARPPWPPGDEIGMANTLGPGDLAALRNLSCRSQGEVLRALPFALEHNAAIAVRRAAAGKI